MKQQIFNFPVTSPVQARVLTEANFDIKDYPELYVELDKVRVPKGDIEADYRQNLKSKLNITPDNKLEEVSSDFVKILFSGHRGSGKTVEMRKFHYDLHKPERFFSVLIELEQELAIDTFQFEDYFIEIIDRLGEEIEKHGIPTFRLNDIIKEWLSNTEIEKEATREAKVKNINEIGTGFSLFEFF